MVTPNPTGVVTKRVIQDRRLVEVPQGPEVDWDKMPEAAIDLRVGHIITSKEYIHFNGQEGRDREGRRRDSLLLRPGETAWPPREGK